MSSKSQVDQDRDRTKTKELSLDDFCEEFGQHAFSQTIKFKSGEDNYGYKAYATGFKLELDLSKNQLEISALISLVNLEKGNPTVGMKARIHPGNGYKYDYGGTVGEMPAGSEGVINQIGPEDDSYDIRTKNGSWSVTKRELDYGPTKGEINLATPITISDSAIGMMGEINPGVRQNYRTELRKQAFSRGLILKDPFFDSCIAPIETELVKLYLHLKELYLN